MSDGTHIEWTDASWNPIRARTRDAVPTGITVSQRIGWQCQRVSPGCQNCYAESINKRLGTGLAYDAKGMAASITLLDEKVLMQPLSWRKPRKVFVCSMTDIAGDWVPDEWLDRMFAVMALTPQHTYQVLTKRPARLREYLSGQGLVANARWVPIEGQAQRIADDVYGGDHFDLSVKLPLPNVWVGTSVEDQERADERIPELLATPAAVRFLSCEPLLGPVDTREYLHDSTCFFGMGICTCSEPREVSLDWVIIGGESGPGARPMDLAWARSLVAQCQAAGVAVFVKQLGADAQDSTPGTTWSMTRWAKRKNRKGGEMSEWPEDLRVREWPGAAVPA